jgi:hypothetical protein
MGKREGKREKRAIEIKDEKNEEKGEGCGGRREKGEEGRDRDK